MEATTCTATVSGFDQDALSEYSFSNEQSFHTSENCETDSKNLLITQKMSWKNSWILFFIFQ